MLFRYFVEIYFDSCFSALLKCYRNGENAVLTFECLAFSGSNAYVAVFALVFGCEGQLCPIIIEFPVAVAPHGIFSCELSAVELVDSAFFAPFVWGGDVLEHYVRIADDSRPYLAFGIGSQNVPFFILYEGKFAGRNRRLFCRGGCCSVRRRICLCFFN